MGRGFRRILVPIVRYFVLRPARFVATLAVLVAAVAAVFLADAAFPGMWTRVGAALPRGTAPAPEATEEFMRGNQEYNADLIWQSLSDTARSRLESQGGSVDAFKTQMDSAKQRGVKLENVSYIGEKSLPDGTSMVFYLVGYRQGADANVEFVPYLFTLDTSGKITKVQ